MNDTSVPQTGVTVVTYNRTELTLRCLRALRQVTAASFHLTVVDNGSEPALVEALQRLQADGEIDVLIRHRRNMGVSVAANTGWESVPSSCYVKLDNDILIRHPGWLDALKDLAEEGGFGATAFRLCSWHTTEPARLPSGRPYQATGAVGGGCILIPRATHEALGFWNEDYVYGWEDLEYSNRILQAGRGIAYVQDDGMVEHLGPDQDARLPEYRQTKKARAGTTSGPKALFLLNTAMFEMNLRPLNVIRKFLPHFQPDGTVTYTQNPEYKGILTRQNLFRRQFIKHASEDDVYLDLPFLDGGKRND